MLVYRRWNHDKEMSNAKIDVDLVYKMNYNISERKENIYNGL